MSSTSGIPSHTLPPPYPRPALKIHIPRTKEKHFEKVVLSPPGAPRHEDKVEKTALDVLKKG